MIPDERQAERGRRARQWLARTGLLDYADRDILSIESQSRIEALVEFMRTIEATTLAEAVDMAEEHGCPSYHELCDCRRAIADDLYKLAQERHT